MLMGFQSLSPSMSPFMAPPHGNVGSQAREDQEEPQPKEAKNGSSQSLKVTGVWKLPCLTF